MHSAKLQHYLHDPYLVVWVVLQFLQRDHTVQPQEDAMTGQKTEGNAVGSFAPDLAIRRVLGAEGLDLPTDAQLQLVKRFQELLFVYSTSLGRALEQVIEEGFNRGSHPKSLSSIAGKEEYARLVNLFFGEGR